jgi:ferredoxin
MDMKKITNCQIYFFSGTGNAKHTAQWMQLEAQKQDIPCELIDIGQMEDRKHVTVRDDSMIGFVAPTHGFNFPPIMFHFILRFPRAKSNPVFIMNTRAGMKAGKLFLPGLSGLAQYFTALILLIKGYKIKAMYPVDLPSNWISLHPALKESVVESIYERQNKKVSNFGRQVFEGKTNFKALLDLVQDLIISPIALGYYLIGRFVLAKSFIASSHCNNCGICIKQCPIKAIKKMDNRMYWTYRCESCMHCMNSCPRRAIETAHGYFAAVIIFVNSFFLYHFYQTFSVDAFLSQYTTGFLKQLITSILSSGIFLIWMVLTYYVMHYLLRFKWFERLIVFTSLTHFRFWRRYITHKSNR